MDFIFVYTTPLAPNASFAPTSLALLSFYTELTPSDRSPRRSSKETLFSDAPLSHKEESVVVDISQGRSYIYNHLSHILGIIRHEFRNIYLRHRFESADNVINQVRTFADVVELNLKAEEIHV